MKVINFFGAPGAGKSTEAARAYVALKDRGVNVELVREHAKDLAWHGGLEVANKVPFYLAGQQMRLQEAFRGKVAVVVSDSPVFMSALYADGPLIPEYERICLEMFSCFHNLNYFVPLRKTYNPAGRTQTRQESLYLQGRLIEMLDRNLVNYREIESGGKNLTWLTELLRDF